MGLCGAVPGGAADPSFHAKACKKTSSPMSQNPPRPAAAGMTVIDNDRHRTEPDVITSGPE
jgi:hypothetical protein